LIETNPALSVRNWIAGMPPPLSAAAAPAVTNASSDAAK